MSGPEPTAPAPAKQSSGFKLNLFQSSQPTAEAPADAAYTARGTATSGYTSWFSRGGSSTAAAEPPPALPGKGSSAGVADEPYTPGGHAVGAYEPFFMSLRRSMRMSTKTLNTVEESGPAPAKEAENVMMKVEARPVASEGDRAAPAAEDSWYIKIIGALGCWRA